MIAQALKLRGELLRLGPVPVDDAVSPREGDGGDALPRRPGEDDLEALDLGLVLALALDPLVGQSPEVRECALVGVVGPDHLRVQAPDSPLAFREGLDQR